MDRQPPQKKRSLAATAMLVVSIVSLPTHVPSLSFSPFPHRLPPAPGKRTLAGARTRTTYAAKLDRIASSFDLNGILSSENEFSATEDDGLSSRKKKNKMKEHMKQQRLEMQQLKKMSRDKKSFSTDEIVHIHGGNFVDDEFDIESRTEYENLIRNNRFSAYEIQSSLDGRRIDAVLVELLNKKSGINDDKLPLSISRTQCGNLLSNDCVFMVPPKDALVFRNSLNAHYENEREIMTVPQVLIEQYCSPIQRKSHIIESGSILVYPTRDSLLPSSSSSSMLLSNLIPPDEIIAQHIPLDILYEDEHMVVINKQAGIVV
jgi:hypothetical protein